VKTLIQLYYDGYEKEFNSYRKKMKKLGINIERDDFRYSFKDCKKYIKKNIKKIKNKTEYFLDNDVHNHSSLLNEFKCFPKEVKKWFDTAYIEFYKPVIKTKESEVLENEINLFKGFKHQYKEFKTFSKKTQKAVHYFFDEYIKDSLCSNNEKLFKYVKCWFANMIQGNKNISALVLKGTQGIGKSTVINFLRDYVLGTDIFLNSNNRPLATDFNYPLMGKLFVTFEELHGSNACESKKIEAQFKDMVTNLVTSYKREHCSSLENIPNINNYMTTSNDFGALKGEDGRRFCILDISTKHINNHDGFFNTLRDKCFNDEVGWAFYCYCCEIDVSNFDSTKIPETKRKIEAQLNSLTPVIEFIRTTYLFKKTSLKIKCYSLYKAYVQYCFDHGIRQMKKKLYFYQQMEHYGLEKSMLNGQSKYNYDYETLQNRAKNFKWDMEDEDTDKEDSNTEDEVSSVYIEENKKLKERIAELENKIKDLQSSIEKDDTPIGNIVQQLLSF